MRGRFGQLSRTGILAHLGAYTTVVACWSRRAASTASNEAQKRSASPCERHSGGTSRKRRGRDRVDEDPARAQRFGDLCGRGVRELDAQQQAGAAHVVDARAGAAARAAMCSPTTRAFSTRSSRSIASSTASAAAAIGGRAAERRRVVAALEAGVGHVRGQQRADRQAAGEALGDRDRVGPHGAQLLAEPGAAATDAGLHLVVQQQRAVAVAELARERQPLRRRSATRRPRPGSARRARRRCPARPRRRARRGRCAARARSRPARARTARASRPTSRRRASPACARGTRPRRTRCGAWRRRGARGRCGARA